MQMRIFVYVHLRQGEKVASHVRRWNGNERDRERNLAVIGEKIGHRGED